MSVAATEALQVPETDAGTADLVRASGRHVARSGGIVFGGKVFTYGARFIMALLLARTLGAQEYGLYSLALTTAVLFASFASLGMDTAVVRFVSAAVARGDASTVRGTLQVGIGLPSAVALIGALGVFAFADDIAVRMLEQPAVADLLRVTAALVLVSVLNRQLVAALQGFKRIELAVVAEQFAQPVIRLGLLLVLALVGLTAWNAALAATMAAAAAALFLAAFLVLRMRRVAAVPAKRSLRAMLFFALPVYFSNIVTTVGNNIQILLLGALGTLSAVGIFAVASQVNLISALFHTSIVAASMPLFAELQERGQTSAAEGLYRMTSKWTFALGLPFFLVVVLFPSQILAIFGPEFEDGATALVIVSVASLVNSATGTSGALLDMSGFTKVKLLNATVGVATSVALSLMLIPPLGLTGAAVAVLGSTATINGLRVIEARVLAGMSPYDRSFLAPIVAGAVAAVVAVAVFTMASGLAEIVATIAGAVALMLVYAAILAKLSMSAEDAAFLARVSDRFMRRDRRHRGEGTDHSRKPDD